MASKEITAGHIADSRTERGIALCRVLVAVSCAGVVALSRGSAPGHIGAFSLIAAFLAYSVAILSIAWNVDIVTTRSKVTVHALDVLWGLSIVAVTGGRDSALTPYLVFLALFAWLRWPGKAVVWTGSVTLVALLAMGLTGPYVGHTRLQPDPFTHAAFLATACATLAWVGTHEQRRRREITDLAHRRRAASDTGEMLQAISAAIGAPRAALAWTERDSPMLSMQYWTGTALAARKEHNRTPESLVAEPLAEVDFLCADTTVPEPIVLFTANGDVARGVGRPLPGDVLTWFDARSIVAVRIEGTRVRGRLFLLDVPAATTDTLQMASLLTTQIQAHLDARCLADIRISEERVRLARNLHDGVMQSLTGIGLQLEAARRAIGAYSEETERLVRELQDTVLAEYRELRKLVRQLQGDPVATYEHEMDLVDTITALVLRIERQWTIRIKVETPLIVEHLDSVIPVAVAHEVYYILREALINAARHSGAETVSVRLGIGDGHVSVMVTDDGHGFPFHGEYDLAMLLSQDIGPAVLRERVLALSGTLTIYSTPMGARVHITLPLPVAFARPERT